MFYSSRKGSSTRKQASFARTMSSKHEDGNKSGNETDGGSAELLDISTSREDLSPSRCSCHSGGSNVAVRSEEKDGRGEYFWSGNLKLEFDNNNGSDDEQLKEELLRIFDRERLGLESYFKQKTENILQGYRRKQYEWEEKLRLDKMEYEKNLAQEKIEVQQNYIGEMTNLTKQFNQERIELESHYKKQIEELSQQFELRKKEMDATIIKERTELKQRLEVEYEAMLKSQKAADEQRFRQQISDIEERYKKKILELEQKLKDSFSEGELSGRRLQSELEAKFEQEKSLLAVEWRKRVEVLEVELGKEKERANKEERKACESHGFLRNEISKKDVEIEKLRQVIETLKLELFYKEKTAQEHEVLQQNIFLRGCDALPGKLREDFEKMMSAQREDLEQNLRKEYEGLESEREKRLVLERETMEKQMKLERERMSIDLEKERTEMRHANHGMEGKLRGEMREEMERMRAVLESEKEMLREQVRAEVMKEKRETGNTFMKEKEERDAEIERKPRLTLETQVETRRDHERELGPSVEDDEAVEGRLGRDKLSREGLGQNHLRFEAEEAERRRNGLGRDEYGVWLAGQKMKHTKQWVEGQYRFSGDSYGYEEDSDHGLRRDSTGNDDKDKRGNEDKQRRMRDDNPGYFEGAKGGRNYEMDRHKQKHPGDHGRREMDNDGYGNDNEGLRGVSKGGRKDEAPSESEEDGTKKEYSTRGLREENEGLKAKVKALNENLELHVCYKKEAGEELERLRNTNKDLKMKLEQLKDTVNDYDGLQDTLKNYERQLKDYEGQMKENEVRIKEYEDICAEYERSLEKCREKIMVIEKDRETSNVSRSKSGGARKRSGDVQVYPSQAKPNHKGIMHDDTGSDYSGYLGSKMKPREEMAVNILENEKSRLENLVQSLEEKIKHLELKISEITLGNQQANKISEEKIKLTSDLDRVRAQNKGLLNKVKDLQCQLQAMIDKLRKKKKKISGLKNENVALKSSYRAEICEHEQKLKYSSEVISRLQHESRTESSTITRLQEEISNITNMMMEDRVTEQRMFRARSVEEMEKLRDLDRDKVVVEKKMQDAMSALDGYSERLKNKISHSEMANSQLSLNAETNASYLRDLRLSKTLQALQESRKTSRRQNERLQHEKRELQSLMGRLCKSQEDLRCIGASRTYQGSKISLSSRSSSISSLSSSCLSFTLVDGGRESGLGSTKFSSTFSVFD